jgi:protein-arginine kinase activator protein McsA
MLCNQGHERAATIHVTQVIGSKMNRRDLCDFGDGFDFDLAFPS